MKTILYILSGAILLLGVLRIDSALQNRVDVKYDACAWQFGVDYQTLGLSIETFPEYQINCMKVTKITNTK